MNRIGEFVKGNLPGASASQFADAMKAHYQAAFRGLGPDQQLDLEYHSPAGEVIHVSRLDFDPRADAFLVDGQSQKSGEWCRIYAPVGTVQLVMRVVKVEGEPDRKPVGFHIPS